eukprot:Lithocolla_globosa_v1_NODE_371_length_4267_cov_4.198718.p4 type:complete len:124 gc:universal NODE_371_length_4267_cov_4.198718:1713-2084(+)
MMIPVLVVQTHELDFLSKVEIVYLSTISQTPSHPAQNSLDRLSTHFSHIISLYLKRHSSMVVVQTADFVFVCLPAIVYDGLHVLDERQFLISRVEKPRSGRNHSRQTLFGRSTREVMVAPCNH